MIELSDHEGAAKDPRHYRRKLKKLQARLQRIQVAHIVHRRAAVVMLEGWDAAGKGGIIQRMVAEWDQRVFEVHPIAAPTAAEKKRDFLWRFRRRLPRPGEIAVFDRSWYGRVLVERVEGYATPGEWGRAYDEINAFEASLADGGTTLVKLFVHTSQEEQDRRLLARLQDPWKRWKTGPDDYRNRARRADYLAAMADMFARTDTGAAPWFAVAGDNKKAARLAALEHVADRLEAEVPMAPPPLDPELERVARAALGGGPTDA